MLMRQIALARGNAAYDDAIAAGLNPREAARLREEAWKTFGWR
jgi:hypothetical protein